MPNDRGTVLCAISRQSFPPDSVLVYYLGVDCMDNNWLILSVDGGIVTEYWLDAI